MTLPRPLQPPLRRWGATHRLRRDPAELPSVRRRLTELPPRDAAAALTGVLDALEVVDPPTADELLAQAQVWPHARVRELAQAILAPPAPADTLF